MPWGTSLLVGWLAACTGAPADGPATPDRDEAVAPEAGAPAVSTEVDVAQLQQLQADGRVPVLVDVRTDAEYAEVHVPGTTHIPLDQLEGRIAELDAYKDGPIYVICRSGGRSARAQTLLQGKGLTAVNVAGGTLAWQAAGYPVE